MLRYKGERRMRTQVAAASRVGISERSARRIESSEQLPSQRPRRRWRSRPDPLAEVWETELVPLLQVNPQLNAVTLLEEIERVHPTMYRPSVLRTLQRRVRQWRAMHGAECEVYFAQEHPPGRLGLSDFTDANALNVTIDGEPFDHTIYQFALAHSGWRSVNVLTTGESFASLSDGMQIALWKLGGATEEHRTDSLSAAFKNLNESEQQDLTVRYESLCAHYGMRPSRCNPGESHENGSIESRHGSLKMKLDQALLLRGSRDFADQAAYEAFVVMIADRMNARIDKLTLAAERAALRPLPPRRTAEFDELPARVSKYGIFTVKGAQYSAPSRLIGHRLMVRRYSDRIECYVGGQLVYDCPRAAKHDRYGHGRRIDYRHLIGGLRRKPGAFIRWIHRDEAFPRPIYRRTWESLLQHLPERQACKVIVGLLSLAADGHEAELAHELEALRRSNQLPDVDALTTKLAPKQAQIPTIIVMLPDLRAYDALIEVAS